MDGHVGDDFPDDGPDDFPDEGTDGDIPDGDVPGVGDSSWDDTVDLDGDDEPSDPDWLTDGEHPVGSETVDFSTEDSASDADLPDLPADADRDAPDDADDIPVVGDDSPVGLGADPDAPVADSGDGDWLDLPDLANIEVPEPAGGPPWVDTGLLGDSDGDPADAPVTGERIPATPEGGADDLRASLGEPPWVGDPTDSAYSELVASDDPAVRNLARLWGPSV